MRNELRKWTVHKISPWTPFYWVTHFAWCYFLTDKLIMDYFCRLISTQCFRCTAYKYIISWAIDVFFSSSIDISPITWHTRKSLVFCVECLVFFFLRWIAVIGLCGEKNIGSPIVMVIDCDRNTTKKKNTTQDTELYTQYLNNTRCETQQPFTIYLLQNFTFSSVITKFPQQDIVLIKYRLAKKKKNKLQARWTVNLYSLSKCDFVTIYNANNDVTFALFKLPMI